MACYKDLFMGKLNKDYDNYIRKLKLMDVNEVINHSYETAWKQEILNVFESNENLLEDDWKRILNSQHYDNLDGLYDLWLSTDTPEIWDCLNNVMEFVVCHEDR